MKRNFNVAIFILTIMAIVNPGNLIAGCVTVENDLKFNICADYQGVKYQIPFSFFQHDSGFYWKADAVAAKQIQSGDNCISVANDLNLKFSCADYQGVGYAFVLNYAAYPNDSSGLYWKMDSSTFSISYAVADTGQSKCFNATSEISCPSSGAAFYGQDAQYAGNQPTYTLSSDGLTVKDNNTGLTWQQSHYTGQVYWTEAEAVPAALNAAKYGGYNDWRLPTNKELYSIWKGNTGWHFIDSNYFAISYASEDELSHAIFWSSNKYTGLLRSTSAPDTGAEMAFGVNFGTGHIKAYSISSGPRHLVRCVRGASYGINNFLNNGNDTITDQSTGLMWAKVDSGSGMDWEHALVYVQTQNTANYLGHNDWRLPNTKELQSIVDYTRSPYATNSANVGPAINSMFSCTAITNDGGKADYPYYWTSTTNPGLPAATTYNTAWYVAFGQAEDGKGEDLHGAGAVRFDAKILGSGEGEERVLNYVRLVRDR
jgi:hypothetical protein